MDTLLSMKMLEGLEWLQFILLIVLHFQFIVLSKFQHTTFIFFEDPYNIMYCTNSRSFWHVP